MHKNYILYCDGACSGNPGPGGWAWVCLAQDSIKEDSGYESHTTNNRMELKAAIEGLKAVHNFIKSDNTEPANIEVKTDSQYVKNGVTIWINSWKANGWRTASKNPVKNKELWEELDTLSIELKPHWQWVEGHAGEQWNERCDKLAREAIKTAVNLQ